MQNKKRRPKKSLDGYLFWAIGYIVIWSVAFFAAWVTLKIEPSVLEGCILAPGVIEMICCAWIKRGDTGNDEGKIDE